jgi:hypothetical protein
VPLDARLLVFRLFITILGLDCTRKLPRYNRLLQGLLSNDIRDIFSQLDISLKSFNVEALGILLEHVTEQPYDNELI